MTRQQNKPKNKTGPQPETVTIKGDWEDAVETALKKKRPKEGWPERDEKESG